MEDGLLGEMGNFAIDDVNDLDMNALSAEARSFCPVPAEPPAKINRSNDSKKDCVQTSRPPGTFWDQESDISLNCEHVVRQGIGENVQVQQKNGGVKKVVRSEHVISPGSNPSKCGSYNIGERLHSSAGRRLGEEDLKMELCKKYSEITMDRNADFSERTDFDIRKRNAKGLETVAGTRTANERLDKARQDDLFRRLIEDGKRRNRIKKQLEEFQRNEAAFSLLTGRKLGRSEADQIYQRMMSQEHEKQIDLKKQRMFEEMLKELQLQKIEESSVDHGKSKVEAQNGFVAITTKGVKRMLERFERDSDRRKLSLRIKREQEEALKQEEEAGFFRPKINSKKGKLVSTQASLSATNDKSASTVDRLNAGGEVKTEGRSRCDGVTKAASKRREPTLKLARKGLESSLHEIQHR